MPDRSPVPATVLDAATALHDGDLRRAIAWLQRPAVGLGGIAPVDHLDTPAHIDAVLDLIGRIEHGIWT